MRETCFVQANDFALQIAEQDFRVVVCQKTIILVDFGERVP